MGDATFCPFAFGGGRRFFGNSAAQCRCVGFGGIWRSFGRAPMWHAFFCKWFLDIWQPALGRDLVVLLLSYLIQRVRPNTCILWPTLGWGLTFLRCLCSLLGSKTCKNVWNHSIGPINSFLGEHARLKNMQERVTWANQSICSLEKSHQVGLTENFFIYSRTWNKKKKKSSAGGFEWDAAGMHHGHGSLCKIWCKFCCYLTWIQFGPGYSLETSFRTWKLWKTRKLWKKLRNWNE